MSSYVFGALEDGLVSYWYLDNTTNSSFLVDNENRNNATFVGSQLVNKPGQVNNSVEFDGNNDYINLGSNPSMDDVFDGGATLSMWFKADIVDSLRYLFNSYDTSGSLVGYTFSLDDDSTGSISMNAWFSGTNGRWEFPFSDTSSWHHIVMVYNSSTLDDPIIYLDNVNQSFSITDTNPTGTHSSDAGNNKLLGNRVIDQLRDFDGKMDEVAIWNRTLSPIEIEQIYNNSNAGRHYFDFPTLSVTTNSPANNSKYDEINTISFSCSATAKNLANISLYHNETGTWTLNQTQIFGVVESGNASFNVTFLNSSNKIKWGCEVFDSNSSSLTANRTINLNVLDSTTKSWLYIWDGYGTGNHTFTIPTNKLFAVYDSNREYLDVIDYSIDQNTTHFWIDISTEQRYYLHFEDFDYVNLDDSGVDLFELDNNLYHITIDDSMGCNIINIYSNASNQSSDADLRNGQWQGLYAGSVALQEDISNPPHIMVEETPMKSKIKCYSMNWTATGGDKFLQGNITYEFYAGSRNLKTTFDLVEHPDYYLHNTTIPYLSWVEVIGQTNTNPEPIDTLIIMTNGSNIWQFNESDSSQKSPIANITTQNIINDSGNNKGENNGFWLQPKRYKFPYQMGWSSTNNWGYAVIYSEKFDGNFANWNGNPKNDELTQNWTHTFTGWNHKPQYFYHLGGRISDRFCIDIPDLFNCGANEYGNITDFSLLNFSFYNRVVHGANNYSEPENSSKFLTTRPTYTKLLSNSTHIYFNITENSGYNVDDMFYEISLNSSQYCNPSWENTTFITNTSQYIYDIEKNNTHIPFWCDNNTIQFNIDLNASLASEYTFLLTFDGITPPPPNNSCTYVSGSHLYNLTDNCSITSATTITGDLTIAGLTTTEGYLHIFQDLIVNGNITYQTDSFVGSGSVIWVNTTGEGRLYRG